MKNEMTYAEFLELCREEVERLYNGTVKAEVCSTMKNNSVELQGLLIKQESEKVAPTFYLYHQYDRWCQGCIHMEDILKGLSEAYTEEMKKNRIIAEQLHFEWESFKTRVYTRLVSREKNEQLLKDVPYETYLDMVIVYHYVIPVSEETQGVLILTKEHLQLLGITQEELKAAAMENTRTKMGPVIQPMWEVVTQLGVHCGIKMPKEKPENFMYVLSNKTGLYGAVSMIFSEILEQFSNEVQSSFYILPSSIHEVLLVPDGTSVSVKAFSEMVQEINAKHVEDVEVLSDSVYYYDREIHTVRRVA